MTHAEALLHFEQLSLEEARALFGAVKGVSYKYNRLLLNVWVDFYGLDDNILVGWTVPTSVHPISYRSMTIDSSLSWWNPTSQIWDQDWRYRTTNDTLNRHNRF